MVGGTPFGGWWRRNLIGGFVGRGLCASSDGHETAAGRRPLSESAVASWRREPAHLHCRRGAGMFRVSLRAGVAPTIGCHPSRGSV